MKRLLVLALAGLAACQDRSHERYEAELVKRLRNAGAPVLPVRFLRLDLPEPPKASPLSEAVAALRAGRVKEAREAFDRLPNGRAFVEALDRAEQVPIALTRAREESAKGSDAAEHFERALALLEKEPDTSMTRAHLALALEGLATVRWRRAEKFDALESRLQKLLERAPESEYERMARAEVHVSRFRRLGARPELRAADLCLTPCPREPYGRVLHARVRRIMNRTQEDLFHAFEDLAEAQKTAMGEPWLHREFVDAYVAAGQYAQALQHMESLGGPLVEWGDLLEKAGQPERAVEKWTEALRRDPSLAPILEPRIRLHRK